MAEATAIGWCDHTFNGWQGCQHVSPACDNCYAEAQDARFGCLRRWGPHGERERTSEANWRKPLAWNRKALLAGVRRRVFAMSKADVFDNRVPPAWRADFWRLVRATPHLDWLILTKRPGNIVRLAMLPDDWGTGYPNVWLGTTVESAAYNSRVLDILAVPAVVHFVSAEPLLGDPQLHCIPFGDPKYGVFFNALNGKVRCDRLHGGRGWPCASYGGRRIGWVIAGGETGASKAKVRVMPEDQAGELMTRCEDAGVAFYFKQWGGVGKANKLAGRLLYGAEWSQFPAVPHA